MPSSRHAGCPNHPRRWRSGLSRVLGANRHPWRPWSGDSSNAQQNEFDSTLPLFLGLHTSHSGLKAPSIDGIGGRTEPGHICAAMSLTVKSVTREAPFLAADKDRDQVISFRQPSGEPAPVPVMTTLRIFFSPSMSSYMQIKRGAEFCAGLDGGLCVHLQFEANQA